METIVIVILTIITVAALLFALFCWMHYRLQQRDFEAYQKIAENRRLEDDRHHALWEELNRLRDELKDLTPPR
jgi:hypothetical protein